MWTPAQVTSVRDGMHGRVGSFMRNTVRVPGVTCSTCTVPVSGFYRCYQCKVANDQWDGRLADLVMPLTYAYNRVGENRARLGKHQSEHHMWSYKEQHPGPGPVTDLTMMLLVALQWRGQCAETQVGRPWEAWATVPSSKHARRVSQHPLIGLGVGAGLGAANTGLSIDYAEMRLVGPGLGVSAARLRGVTGPRRR